MSAAESRPTEGADEPTRDETAERADELFARVGDDASARDELVSMFRPLAEYLARRFQGRGEPFDDLAQVATIGLLKAIDRFDQGREVKFTTYATATIMGELKRHFRDKGWSVRVPRRLQETGLKVSRTLSELAQELGRSPTVREIADRASLTDEEVLEGMETVHAYSASSLDAPVDEEGATTLDKMGAEDESLELLEAWATVAPAVRELPPRQRRILYLRFFRGMTQTQIAEEIGISQMHVSRLLARTIRSLQETLGEEA